MVKVTLKWGKEVFENVEIDPTDSVETLQFQIYSLTHVPPERQKILGIGPPLKPNDDLSKRSIKEGAKVMLIGTAEGAEHKVLSEAEKPKLVEDMTPEEIALHLNEQIKGPLPVGLTNLGNTCYMNSCVQMLRRVPELETELSKLAAPAGDNADGRLAFEFQQLMTAMKSSIQPVQPIRFLVALRAKVPSFGERGPGGQFQQQDAEECIRNMLAAFASAMPGENGKNAIDDIFGFETRSVYKCVESEDEPEKVDVTRDRFMMCHFGTATEPISHVREGIKLSLKENVEKHSELLGRLAQYEKTAAFGSTPKYLLVQFARFGWKAANSEAGTSASRVKIGRKVLFPKRLDLYEFATDTLQKELQLNRQKEADYRDKEWEKQEKQMRAGQDVEVNMVEQDDLEEVDTGVYDLQSVVSHQGRSAEGGHYVCWALSKKPPPKVEDKKAKKNVKDEDEWLLFDDEKVSERPDKDVDLCGGRLDTHIAYFCLYKKSLSKVSKTQGAGHVLGSATGSADATSKDTGAAPMDVDNS